jgi:hypothetical protein
MAERHPKLLHLGRLRPQGDLEDQLLGVVVDQKERARAGPDHLGRCLDDQLQQPAVLDRRGQPASTGGHRQGGPHLFGRSLVGQPAAKLGDLPLLAGNRRLRLGQRNAFSGGT